MIIINIFFHSLYMQFRYRAVVQLSLFFHISSTTYQASVLDLLLKKNKKRKTIYTINKIKIIKTCPKKKCKTLIKSEIIMFSVCPTRFGVFGQSLHIAQSIAFYANKGECLSTFAYVTYIYADYFGWKIYLKIFEILLDLCLIVCVWIKN